MGYYSIIFLTGMISLFSTQAFTGEDPFFEEPTLFEVINDDDDEDLYSLKERKVKKKEFDWDLALVAVFQNDAEWLKEWIEYHKIVGVEHFYLYNNLSTDNYLEVLQPYIDAKEVELIDWPNTCIVNSEISWIKVQTDAINDAIKLSKEKTKWLAIIDTYEFIVPIKTETIPELLDLYERIIPKLSQVSIKWVMFGTSDTFAIPQNRLMIDVLTNNAGYRANDLYKSIVKPKDVLECANIHYCCLEKKRRDEYISCEFAQINHYWTRDELYLNEVKVPRLKQIGYPEDFVQTWAASYNHNNPQAAAPIRRFIQILKFTLGKD